MFLPDREGDVLQVESVPEFFTEWGFTYRRLSEAQVSKSEKVFFYMKKVQGLEKSKKILPESFFPILIGPYLQRSLKTI